jgi:hypothetical protein
MADEVMADWQRTFRVGVAPLLSSQALRKLKAALVSDDSRLIQGGTTEPPPLFSVRDWPVESACPIAWCGWQGEELQTVEEVDTFFSRITYECGRAMGDSLASGLFLNWVDDTPRAEMREKLAAEVGRVLELRAG